MEPLEAPRNLLSSLEGNADTLKIVRIDIFRRTIEAKNSNRNGVGGWESAKRSRRW